MTRVKIQLPPHFHFSTSIAVRITDLNYGKHVGNDTILSFLHELRVQFLLSHNYKELDIEGLGLIMSDVSIEYKTELFYGETVKGYVVAAGFSRASFDIFYKMEKTLEQSPIVVAVARTRMVCYDYNEKKIAALPEKARIKLASEVNQK